MVGLDPQDDTRRVLAHVKSNLGQLAESLTFRLQSAAKVGKVGAGGLEGVSSYKADDLTARPSGEERSALAEAKDFLRELLRRVMFAAMAVHKEAKDIGISPATLRRAKEALAFV